MPRAKPAGQDAPPDNAPAARRTVLLLCPYPHGSVPGQRFRYEQYLDGLRRAGYDFDIRPFLDEAAMRVLYAKGHYLRKIASVLAGFVRRIGEVASARRYDHVFIHREAAPIGPPVFELALRIQGVRFVYDFDDAIYVAQKSKANPFMPYIRCAWKVGWICRWAGAVSVCNPFLVDWARRRNDRVLLVPTTIDERYHAPRARTRADSRPVIGWTGSHSTAAYLELVRPALRALQDRYDFEFRVICDHDPGFPELKRYRYVRWRQETEIADLAEFDIGLMPVPDGEWEKGKVGFKAIQYGGLAQASVVSETGSGREVVVDGVTGFAVSNDSESWTRALERLLSDPGLRATMGAAAREHILKRYSVCATASKYPMLFELCR